MQWKLTSMRTGPRWSVASIRSKRSRRCRVPSRMLEQRQIAQCSRLKWENKIKSFKNVAKIFLGFVRQLWLMKSSIICHRISKPSTKFVKSSHTLHCSERRFSCFVFWVFLSTTQKAIQIPSFTALHVQTSFQIPSHFQQEEKDDRKVEKFNKKWKSKWKILVVAFNGRVELED